MNEIASNNIWIRAYSSDGFQVSLTFAVTTAAEAVAKLAEVRAAGFLAAQPESADGERQTIASVMRHVTDKGTQVIATYPNWQYEGKYGEYKFASLYMDSPEDIAQFEAQSGLKLNDIPVSDGEAGVRRKYGKTNPKEVAVKHSFDMLKIPDGTADDGKPRYRYEYATRLPVTVRWSEADAKAFVKRWETDNLTPEDLLKALKVSRLGQWESTRDAADAAVTAYIKANLNTEPATTKAGAAASVQSH